MWMGEPGGKRSTPKNKPNQKNANDMKKSNLTCGLLTLALIMVTGNLLASPPPPQVPDAASSAWLLSIGLAGLAAVRRFVR
jgi:hypothetical protein